MRFLFAIVLGLCMLSPVAFGRDVHVNNLSGDDRCDGSQPRGTEQLNGPVRTITKAMRLAGPGDTVKIANTGVPYQEMISISGGDHCGTPGAPFTIEGNGAVLDGSIPVPSTAWEHLRDDVFRFRPRLLGYQQLFRGGRPLVRRPVPEDADRPEKLEPGEWYFHGGYIHFRVEEDRLIDDYQLAHAGQPVGITLYKVHDVRVTDLIVQGFQLDGVNAHEGVRDGVLVGLICRGNGRSGIAVGGTSRLEIESCISGDNGYTQLLTDGLSVTLLIGTQLLENSAPGMIRKGGDVRVVEAVGPRQE